MLIIELCLGHLCPGCKQFWKHRPAQPTVGFACNNQITLMPCPTCLSGKGGPPTAIQKAA